ncbi:hypothetical protein D3C72_461550 [compost metagenome]
MLDAVAQLPQHGVGDVQRILGHEINAHALGPHQPHHLLDLVQQRGRCVVEQQVRFIEKENQLGLVHVAHFGQLFIQVGQEPEQKNGVQPRRLHQFVGGQHVDHAAPLGIGAHQVGHVQHGFAKELFGALRFQRQQAALDGAHAGGGHIAVAGLELGRTVRHVLQHGAQVFQVKQQLAFIVGHLEYQGQDPFLRVVQFQDARQQQWPHIGNGGPHRQALLAEHVPEGDGAGAPRGLVQAQAFQPLGQFGAGHPRLRYTGQVALHVRHEHRRADA